MPDLGSIQPSNGGGKGGIPPWLLIGGGLAAAAGIMVLITKNKGGPTPGSAALTQLQTDSLANQGAVGMANQRLNYLENSQTLQFNAIGANLNAIMRGVEATSPASFYGVNSPDNLQAINSAAAALRDANVASGLNPMGDNSSAHLTSAATGTF